MSPTGSRSSSEAVSCARRPCRFRRRTCPSTQRKPPNCRPRCLRAVPCRSRGSDRRTESSRGAFWVRIVRAVSAGHRLPTPAALSSSDTAARTSPSSCPAHEPQLVQRYVPAETSEPTGAGFAMASVVPGTRSPRNDETASGTLLRLSARRGKTEHSQHPFEA